MDQFVCHEPIGPVAAFSPWNFPATLAMRKVASALAAGCTVVLKPAEETPAINAQIARLCQQAELPRGVLNILYGVPSEISSQLIASSAIKKISFTGSVPVGRALAKIAGEALKPITLELGGHSPVIIMNDVDVAQVAKFCASAKFRNAGQLCIAPTRFYVHKDIYDAFVKQFASIASSLTLGNGLDAATQMGPLANGRRFRAMEAFCRDVKSKGGQVATGGEGVSHLGKGFFWKPTVIEHATPDMSVMKDEPFGPLALIAPFDSLESAIEAANASEYGLASYAFTNSLHSARLLVHELQCGLVGLNTFTVGAPDMPFGGRKHSGIGSEMGPEGMSAYMTPKSVFQKTVLDT
jgi:succinate-semialdehyde dehydrogenase/glutarate-semialdehyde dehydrogenase